jgi:hypothetical protein
MKLLSRISNYSGIYTWFSMLILMAIIILCIVIFVSSEQKVISLEQKIINSK